MATKSELLALLRECRRYSECCIPTSLIPRIDAVLAPEPQGETVRVRAAVGIDKHGRWSIGGNCGMDDSIAERAVSDSYEFADWEVVQVHFIEADVPLPVSKTIQGEVTP